MRYVRLIGKIILALAVGLGLLIATMDESEVASLDPYHPATLLPLVASRLHAVQSFVRDFRASDLIDAATADFRERIRHENPKESLVP
jgi:hypothetical protein